MLMSVNVFEMNCSSFLVANAFETLSFFFGLVLFISVWYDQFDPALLPCIVEDSNFECFSLFESSTSLLISANYCRKKSNEIKWVLGLSL